MTAVAETRGGRDGQAGQSVVEFALGQPSLDEVFLALTGHTAEDQAEEEEAAWTT